MDWWQTACRKRTKPPLSRKLWAAGALCGYWKWCDTCSVVPIYLWELQRSPPGWSKTLKIFRFWYGDCSYILSLSLFFFHEIYGNYSNIKTVESHGQYPGFKYTGRVPGHFLHCLIVSCICYPQLPYHKIKYSLLLGTNK